MHGRFDGAVEFEDVVVDTSEGVADVGAVKLGGVGQHGDFCGGEVAVAQAEDIVDDSGEVGVERGLAVAGVMDSLPEGPSGKI